MLSYEAERRAYLGEDPAEIVADEMQAEAVRATVSTCFPGYSAEVLDESDALNPWALAELRHFLYPWSETALDAT